MRCPGQWVRPWEGAHVRGGAHCSAWWGRCGLRGICGPEFGVCNQWAGPGGGWEAGAHGRGRDLGIVSMRVALEARGGQGHVGGVEGRRGWRPGSRTWREMSAVQQEKRREERGLRVLPVGHCVCETASLKRVRQAVGVTRCLGGHRRLSLTPPCRSVWIEKESINSVIVSDSPEDLHQRMLVAASLSVNATGEWGALFIPGVTPLPSPDLSPRGCGPVLS